MMRYQNVVIDTGGNAIPSATVGVYLAGTATLAVTYSTNTGTVKANPFLTDITGGFTFYAADGRYDVHLSKTGYTFGTDLYDIQLADLTTYTSFTPAFTSLTETLGGGTVTYTGKYLKSGNLLTFIVTITPAGGASTTSIAGTTYLTLPVTLVNPGILSVANLTSNVSAAIGVGSGPINTTKAYLPSWLASTSSYVLIGQYGV